MFPCRLVIENIHAVVCSYQIPEIILQPGKFLYKVCEIICVRPVNEVVHCINGGNGEGLVVFAAGAEVVNVAAELAANVVNGFFQPVLPDLYPGQPEVSFVSEDGCVQRACLELLFKPGVSEVEVCFHGSELSLQK